MINFLVDSDDVESGSEGADTFESRQKTVEMELTGHLSHV